MMSQKEDLVPQQEYNGVERRRHFNNDETVQEVKRDLEELKKRVDDIYYMLHRFEGMSLLVKFLFIAALPVWLLIVWFRDHIKW